MNPSVNWWASELCPLCLYFVAVINNASRSICVQVFVWIDVLNPVEYILRGRVAG